MKALWLDNDLVLIRTEIKILEDLGFDVRATTRLSEAENILLENRFDLVIIDAMVPTKNEEEEKIYKPKDTDYGMHSGAIFYSRMKERMEEIDATPLVITQRLDQNILAIFVAAGLPEGNLIRKIETQSAKDFKIMIYRLFPKK